MVDVINAITEIGQSMTEMGMEWIEEDPLDIYYLNFVEHLFIDNDFDDFQEFLVNRPMVYDNRLRPLSDLY